MKSLQSVDKLIGTGELMEMKLGIHPFFCKDLVVHRIAAM
jgi:hypothetical protein